MTPLAVFFSSQRHSKEEAEARKIHVLSLHIIMNMSVLSYPGWYDVELECEWKTERGKQESNDEWRSNEN